MGATILLKIRYNRELHSYRMVNSAIKRKAHILGRVPTNVKFEVVKVFEDGLILAQEYHTRWEIENTFLFLSLTEQY